MKLIFDFSVVTVMATVAAPFFLGGITLPKEAAGTCLGIASGIAWAGDVLVNGKISAGKFSMLA